MVEKPKIVPIEIDATGITVNGKTYLLEHISQIGTTALDGYVTGGSASREMASNVMYWMSGQITIKYGGDTIVLVKGMKPTMVESAYLDLQGILERYGFKLGDGYRPN